MRVGLAWTIISTLALIDARAAAAQWRASSSRSFAAPVDAYVAPLIDLQVFSGTILAARGDSDLLDRSYGLADVKHGFSVKFGDVFRIASISKSFTKGVIGRLVDKHVLTLDDPISRGGRQCPWRAASPCECSSSIGRRPQHEFASIR